MNSNDAETMAEALEATGEYRILRQLKPYRPIDQPSDAVTRTALFIDLETTGLDPARDEIIEIAMVPFTYGLDGRIYKVGEPFQRLRQPKSPVPAEITNLTGITNEMVAGKTIDPTEVAAFAVPADLVIAHNAGFDRPFAERFCAAFVLKPWACSMSQVPWAEEGLAGTRLEYLAMGSGFYFDAHRATGDCQAAIELLSRPLPRSRVLAMAMLVESARKSTCRIWAENSPYDLKDVLKARGYRWNGDVNGRPRAWYLDVVEETFDAEVKFLRNEIYQYDVDLAVTKISAQERFSDRV